METIKHCFLLLVMTVILQQLNQLEEKLPALLKYLETTNMWVYYKQEYYGFRLANIEWWNRNYLLVCNIVCLLVLVRGIQKQIRKRLENKRITNYTWIVGANMKLWHVQFQ